LWKVFKKKILEMKWIHKKIVEGLQEEDPRDEVDTQENCGRSSRRRSS
jgi:hypothetical protein